MTDRKPPEGWIRTEGPGVCPDPTSEMFQERAWSQRYGPQPDIYAASVMDAYSTLLTHPNGLDILRRARLALQTQQRVVAPEMVYIPAPPGEAYSFIESGTVAPVIGFSIGKYPVTQAEWAAVMGNNPSYFTGDPRLPVERVSWHEATAYCDKISDALGLTGGDRYRLPTEAEWEWAASGGGREDRAVTAETGWYAVNSGWRTHPVGKKKPNAFGLHDTLGNIWEWCSTAEGSDRVSRGGSWFNTPACARVAYRLRYAPGDRFQSLGFRLARGGQ